MSDGRQRVTWWNRDQEDEMVQLKTEDGVKIKKEDPSTPLLDIKVEPPPTPRL